MISRNSVVLHMKRFWCIRGERATDLDLRYGQHRHLDRNQSLWPEPSEAGHEERYPIKLLLETDVRIP